MTNLFSILLLAAFGLNQGEGRPADNYDVPPKLQKQTKPKYPVEAFNRHVEGDVTLEYVIDVDGKARDFRVLKSIPPLDAAAVQAVQKWRFAPAQKDGKPVPTVAQSPVSFCIDDNCPTLRDSKKKK